MKIPFLFTGEDMDIKEYLASQGYEAPPEEKTDYSLADGSYLVDADTYALPTGEKVRLQGTNAREVPGFDQEKGVFKAGTSGGELQQEITNRVIKEQGFNTPVYGGKDLTGSRQLGDLVNKNTGRSLTDYALSHGLQSATELSSQEQVYQTIIGRLDRAKRKDNEAVDRFERQLNGENVYSDIGDFYHDFLTAETSKVPLRAKPFARTAKEYGANPDEYVGPEYIGPDETRKGEARNNFTTGLAGGYAQMKQGLYGAVNMASQKGSDAEKWSADHITQLQNSLEDLPTLRNANAFNEVTGKFQLDNFTKLYDYTIGMAAQSAPQMVATLGAYALSGPTMGLSLSVPAAIYTGQIWNDQAPDKKNATYAILGGIGSAVLDNVGIKGVAGAITSKEVKSAVVNKYLKDGLTLEAAEAKYILETKKVTNQLLNAGKAVIVGGTGEGLTETGQQGLQYLATNQKFDLSDPELKNQLMNAGFGGTLLGGVFSGTGRAIVNATTNPDKTPRTSDVQFREEIKKNRGYIPTTHEVIYDALNKDTLEFPDLEVRAQPETAKRESSGFIGGIKNWYEDKGFSSLIGKYSDMITGDRGHRGVYSAAIATLLGSNNAVNGGDIHANQEFTAGNIRSQMGNLGDIRNNFGGKTLSQISSILYRSDVKEYLRQLLQYKEANQPIDDIRIKNMIASSKLSGEGLKNIDAITAVADKLQNTIKAFNDSTNSKATLEDILGNRPFNKMAISKNREGFLNDIERALGITRKQALDLHSSIMNNTNNLTMEDSFEDLAGFGNNPAKGSHADLKDKLHKANENGLLNKYFHGNLFDNIDALAHRGGLQYVNNTMIGKNGNIFAALLHRAVQANEMSEEEANYMAREIQDFLKIREGKYKTITNPLINGALDTITFFSTLASLPLATVSSIPEAAQVMRGLNVPQARKAYKRLLINTAQEMSIILKELGSNERTVGLESREALARVGFATGDQSTANRYDVHSGYFQEWTNGFFKIVGLQGWTNATRYARLSIGADAINSWLNKLKNVDYNNLNQDQQDAYEHLVNIGIDPHLMNDPLIDQAHWDKEIERGTYNFVNEAVVHPNALNRPKFYSDPHLRMFTMFQGYMSTFTAQILPKLYGDMGKKGSADQKNAMATVATILALSALAILLKDMIKYGESPPKWLQGDDAKMLQRFAGVTGLLGTGERVLNFVHPIIEKKAGNAAEQLYNILEGESPTISFSAKVAKAVNAVVGEGTQPIKKIAGISPIIGPVNQLGDYLDKEFGGR